MPSCNTINFKLPDGTIVTGTNTVVKDLAQLLDTTEQNASDLVDKIVNFNSKSPGSFGAWYNLQQNTTSALNPYLNEEGLITGAAVYQYIKELELRRNNETISIRFPDLVIEEDIAEPVLETITVGLFNRIYTQDKKDINQMLYELANGEPVFDSHLENEIRFLTANFNSRDSVDVSQLGQLVRWYIKAENEGKTALASKLEKLINNLNSNPNYLKYSLYDYLSNLTGASTKIIEQPDVTTEVTEEGAEVDVTTSEEENTFDEPNDSNLEEEDKEGTRDSASYQVSLATNHRLGARPSVFLFANTIPDYNITVKEESLDKDELTINDYIIKPAYDPDTFMRKVADGKKIMRILHNFLADDIPSIDALLTRLEEKRIELFKNPDTANDALYLTILEKRLSAYENIDSINDAIDELLDSDARTLIDNKNLESLLLFMNSRTEFVQQFTKMNNSFSSQVVNIRRGYDSSFIKNILLVDSVKVRIGSNAGQIIQGMINNALNEKGLTAAFNEYKSILKAPASPIDMFFIFMDYLGVDIPNIEYYTTVNLDGKPVVSESQSALYSIASKIFDTSKNQTLINSAADLNGMFNYNINSKFIGTQMRKFLNLVGQYSFYDYEINVPNFDGKRLYSIGLYHHIGLTASYINKFLRGNNNPKMDELLQDQIGNVGKFHKEAPSTYLQEIRDNGNSLKIGVETGIEQKVNNRSQKTVSTRKLTTQDRVATIFNSIKNGSTPFIQAADRPVHMNTRIVDANGNLVNTYDTDMASLKNKLINAIRYELLVSREYFNEGVGAELKDFGNHMQDFRLFKGLASKLGMSMEELANLPLSILDPTSEPTVFANKAGLNKRINDFIDQKTAEWTNEFKDYLKNQQVSPSVTNQIVNMEVFVLNEVLGHFEQTRLFFGDIAVFKNSNEVFKRAATANSSKQVQRVDPEMNTFIEATLYLDSFENTAIEAAKKESPNVEVLEDWLAFSEAQILDGNHTSVVFQDPVSNISKDNPTFKKDMEDTFITYLQNLGVSNPAEQAKEWVEGYDNNEHADSAGFINMDAYRRIQIRNGAWFPEHEKLYHKILNEEAISLKDIKSARFTPLKLQYSGFYKSGQHKQNGFYANRKFAAFPAIPGIVPEGSALAEVMDTMNAHRIEFGFFASSAKVIHGPTFSFYGFKQDWESRLYNPETDKETLVDILPAQFMGIQQNINQQSKNKVTSSIQLAKNILTNLYDSGEIKVEDQTLRNDIENYENLSEEVVRREAERLIKELNIPELTTYDDFYKTNFNDLVNLLKEAARNRNYTRDVLNVIDQMSIENPELGSYRSIAFLEELPIYDSVQYLLTAIFRNRVVSKKRKGEGYVQAPAVGTELNKDSVNIEDSLNQTYQMYRKAKDGKTWLPMQIGEPLPDDLFNYVANTYGNGKFTQKALDAFNEDIRKDEEAFVNSNGKKVSNLTKIRKRIGYRIPHQAASSTEVIHVIKFTHPALNTQVIVPKELIKKNGSDYDVDKMNVYKPYYSATKKGITYSSTRIDAEYEKYKERQAFLGLPAVTLTKYEKDKMYFEEYSNAALFNALLESEMNISIHPENIAQLLAPLSESYLTNDSKKGIVDKVLDLKQVSDESVEFSELLTPTTQIKKFKLYNGVKSNVGTAAINIGWFPIFQKGNYVFNTGRSGLANLLLEDTIKPNTELSLGDRTTQNGKLKSEVASQYANAYLDSAAKTGYPQLVNMTGKNAGILFFGLHIGADPYKTLLILNQPVIDSYIRQKEKQMSATNTSMLSNKQIEKNVIGPYVTGSKGVENYLKSTVTENDTLTVQDLEKAIRNPLSPRGKEVQQIVLKLYQELLDINKDGFNFSSANSSDRSNFKSLPAFESSVETEQAGSDLFYASETESAGDISFLRKLKDVKKEFLDKINTLFIYNHPDIKETLSDLKRDLAEEYQYDREELIKILNALNHQTVMFAMSSKVLGKRGFNYGKTIKDTMQAKNSVGQRIFQIKNNPNHPLHNTPLINALTPILNYQDKGYDVVKPDLSNVNPRERKAIIKQHSDLLKGNATEQKLATDLIRLAIVQSGLETSGFNLNSILNQEAVYNYVAPYINNFMDAMIVGDYTVINRFKVNFVGEFVKTFASKYNWPPKIISKYLREFLPTLGSVEYNSKLKRLVSNTIQGNYVIPSDSFYVNYGGEFEAIVKDPIEDKLLTDSANTKESIREEIIEERIASCKSKKKK